MKYGAKLTGSIKQALSGLQGYDIMALDLIQNATDAGAEEITFDIYDNGLRIYNNKQFTSCGLLDEDKCGDQPMCDFHAISQFASANKSSNSKYIGRFGIGFVSVYQITDEPVIHSNGKKMKMNPLEEDSDVSDIEEEIDGTCFYLPWVLSDTALRKELRKSPVGQNICEEVLQGIEKVGEKCLFFLKKLKCIKVLENGKLVKNFTLNRKANIVSITTECCKSGVTSQDKYCVFEGEIDSSDLEEKYRHLKESNRNNDIQVAIALKDIERFKSQGLIFAYLPTEQKTNMPIHINADFFPESNRKKIILSGEDYEKHWNFALLEGAADLVADNLLNLRDKLKYKAFWNLLHSIYYNSDENFTCFREKITEAAQQIPCVFTESEKWVFPSEAVSVDNDEINSNKQKALSKLGFNIVHPDISGKVDFLGITPLDIYSFVEMLENQGSLTSKKELLGKVHSIADKLCKDIDGGDKILESLKEVKMIPYGKKLLSINNMRRLPSTIEKGSLPSVMSDLQIVDKKFKRHANLYRLFRKLDFSNLGSELEKRIVDSDASKQHIGGSEAKIKKFYNFLLNYPSSKGSDGWEAIPLFYCKGTFYSINDSVKLPSEFTDPFDKFNIIDKKLLNHDIVRFFKKTFGIKEQSAKEYLLENFADDFGEYETVTIELYEKTLLELLGNFGRIDKNVKGIRDLLKDLALVWTEDNKLEKASECYFKTPFLMSLLGDQKKLWVNEKIIPKNIKEDVEKLFIRLGIRDEEKIDIHDIKERVDAITEETPTLQSRDAVQEILAFLIKNTRKYKENIGLLANIDWLPGKYLGELDKEQWYKPEGLYQPKKAEIFYSQVTILDINEDLKVLEGYITLCNALNIKFEPNMDILISHIAYCAENDESLDYQIYEIMRKLYTADKNEDKPYIKILKEMACIYERKGKNKKYLEPDKFFWSPPGLLNYRHTVPASFIRSKKFFEAIGIREKPDIIDFAKIILEISDGQGDLPNDEMILYFYCLEEVSKGAKEFIGCAPEAIEMLKSNPSILTINNTFTYPHQVFICKDDDIRDYFGGKIDGYIIKQEHNFDNIKGFLADLGVKEISNAFYEKGIFSKDEVRELPDFNNKIRSDLFLYVLSWELHHNGIEYESILEYLREIRFYSVENLKVQYKFVPAQENVEIERNIFFDGKSVYLKKENIGVSWIPIFIAIFSKQLSAENYIISNIAGAANRIMRNPNNELEDMKELGYKEPPKEKLELDYSILASSQLENIEEASQDEFEENQNLNMPSQRKGKKLVNGLDLTTQRSKESRNRQSNFGNRTLGTSGPRRQSIDSPSLSSSGRSEEINNIRSGTSIRRGKYSSYPISVREENNPHSSANQSKKDTTDKAAIKAVMNDLKLNKYDAEEQEHSNAGYDIRATKGNECRIIEVKGLKDKWGESGVSLSQAQMQMAYEEKENFWLYVVELATTNPTIYRIQNPFAEISNFYFSDVYKEFSQDS